MRKTSKTNDLAQRIKVNIYKGAENDMLSNSDLVQIIILIFDLLNVMTISQYAKQVGKTYAGVKRHCKHLIKINQFTFVADNE